MASLRGNRHACQLDRCQQVSFNTLLLLERVQLSWFPGWLPEDKFATALHGNPVVAWYLQNKCPEIKGWLEQVMSGAAGEQPASPEQIRQAEIDVMRSVNDLLVYAVNPAIYDAQAFLGWDSRELTDLVDLGGKTIIDVGAGTGRLALTAAEKGEVVFAVEPVGNLRTYLRLKARKMGFENVFSVDGHMTEIPFPAGFADVVMSGHVYGDHPEEEVAEMLRVTKTGGMVILCPGNNDVDNEAHQCLVERGFQWSRFEEPEDGTKRKYWKVV